jgi:hypothetical protein
MLQLCRKAKVAYLQPHVCVQEEVAKLQVPVDDPPSVQVLQSHNKVVDVKHRLWL